MPVHGTAVIDGNDKDHQDPVIDREDCTVHADTAGAQRHLLVALEFFHKTCGVLFCGKVIERVAYTPGIFFWDGKEVLLGPAGKTDGVHVRSRVNRRTRSAHGTFLSGYQKALPRSQAASPR